MQGKYAYIGVGQRLTILDVSDPAKFLEWGSTEPFEWYVEDTPLPAASPTWPSVAPDYMPGCWWQRSAIR